MRRFRPIFSTSARVWRGFVGARKRHARSALIHLRPELGGIGELREAAFRMKLTRQADKVLIISVQWGYLRNCDSALLPL